MPEKKKEHSPWRDLWIVFGVLLFLILWWFISGGPQKYGIGSLFIQSPFSTSSPAVQLPVMPGSGVSQKQQNYQNTFYVTPSAPQLAGIPRSPYAGSVTIDDHSGVGASDPQAERVVLYANPSNTSPVVISGWQLKSMVSSNTATIGGGATMPLLASAITTGAIALSPGQSAIITTGRSPIGLSFRENACTGYLDQFQEFTPPLPLSCPFPQQELSENPTLNQEQTCVQAVSSLAPCQAVISAPPGVSSSCAQFIAAHFTYNSCVAIHQNDQNFTGNEWRVFLGQSSELWNKQSDVIALLDQHGKLISAVSY